jgi:hypothetical protein
MSGQWNPYARENEVEQASTEVGQSLESEPDDSETDEAETDTKHEHRFRRRTD